MKTIPFPFRFPFPDLARTRSGAGVDSVRVLRLEPDRVIRLERNSKVSGISVESGLVWVTDTPAGRDILLPAGENLPVRGGWPVVVQALRESVIRLS